MEHPSKLGWRRSPGHPPDLVANIDGEAAEHGVGPGRQRRERVEHEFMRDRLALFDRKEWIVHREEGRIATGLRHGI